MEWMAEQQPLISALKSVNVLWKKQAKQFRKILPDEVAKSDRDMQKILKMTFLELGRAVHGMVGEYKKSKEEREQEDVVRQQEKEAKEMMKKAKFAKVKVALRRPGEGETWADVKQEIENEKLRARVQRRQERADAKAAKEAARKQKKASARAKTGWAKAKSGVVGTQAKAAPGGAVGVVGSAAFVHLRGNCRRTQSRPA